ncbi:MAG: NUDIX hydrolase [Propionibacteriales bacterium]|nr:NUDIX hydrolase [Propionibacteriales bacterium]
MRDPDERIVLCRTTFKPDWELPGGIVEPGETPRDGALREVSEELGLDLEVGRLLIMDWMPPYLGWEDACELIFDGGLVEPADLDCYVLDGHEIAEVRLVTLAEAGELVTPLSHRRLTIASSLQPGAFAYTENGKILGATDET